MSGEGGGGGSLLRRLRRGLGVSLGGGERLERALDPERLRSLEKLLLEGDVGPRASKRIVERMRGRRFSLAEGEGREALGRRLREALAECIAEELRPAAVKLEVDGARKPFVVLASGVNGGGKTTSLGKLAARWRGEGRDVLLAAADSFRAAAVEQLGVWAGRAGVDMEAGRVGEDPAAIAYRALERAKREGRDVLLVDTAGRVANRADLMAESAKLVRVMRKLDASAPHASLLVLDASTGQNALMQARGFLEAAEVSGLVVTKLDGAAKGGVLLALYAESGLPIHFVGFGEGLEDLRVFDASLYARALVGIAGG